MLQLLLTSPNNGGLIYFNGKQCLNLPYDGFTGLYADDEKILLVDQKDGAKTIVEVNSAGRRTHRLSESRLDLHDVFQDGNDIYAVHTETNSVVRYDLNFNFIEEYILDGEVDSSHINCIANFNGRLIASIFGVFTKHREYKGNSLDAGRVIDIKTNEVLIYGLSQPHSLEVDGEYLYLCNSERKEVHKYKGFIFDRKILLSHYTRGIFVDENKIYVGLNRSRNLDDASTQSSITVINKADFSIEEVHPIDFAEVYDIKNISNPILLLSLIDYLNEKKVELIEIKLERAEELTSELERAQERIGELTCELGMAEELVGQHKSDLINLTTGLKKADHQIQSQTSELINLVEKIHQLQSDKIVLEDINKSIINSKSFRWTSPLRKFKQLLNMFGK